MPLPDPFPIPPSVFPVAIDGETQLPTLIDGISEIKASDINGLRSAILNIEYELGVNPSGDFDSVAERLDALGLDDVITGDGEGENNSVARFYGSTGTEIRDSLVFIDDLGNITLPALATFDGRDVSVDGTNLDSHIADLANPHQTSVSNLSDVSLDSPALNDLLVYDSGEWVNKSLSEVGGLGLQYWTESAVAIALPHRPRPLSTFTPNNPAVNADAVIIPKGSGAILAQIPDGLASGGEARGEYAVDFQRDRGFDFQVASGNYSVISGGSDNMASGVYSFVGGGFANVASGRRSVVVGGRTNDASNDESIVIGGVSNSVYGEGAIVGGGVSNNNWGNFSGIFSGRDNVIEDLGVYDSTIAGGTANRIRSSTSAILGGAGNIANASSSSVLGGLYAKTFMYGEIAFASGKFATSGIEGGDAQQSFVTLRNTTTSETSVLLYLNGSSLQIATQTGSSYFFRISVTARQTAGTAGLSGDMAWWDISGGVKNISGVAALVNPVVTNFGSDDNASGWNIDVGVSGSNLTISATGEIDKTIRWVASAHLVKVN